MLNKIETIEAHYQLTPRMVLPSLLVSAVCAADVLDIGWSGKTCTIKNPAFIVTGAGGSKALSLLDALSELAIAEAAK